MFRLIYKRLLDLYQLNLINITEPQRILAVQFEKDLRTLKKKFN